MPANDLPDEPRAVSELAADILADIDSHIRGARMLLDGDADCDEEPLPPLADTAQRERVERIAAALRQARRGVQRASKGPG